VPGPPVSLVFAPNWWTLPGTCVFGDGIVCSMPPTALNITFLNFNLNIR
jgi:hypothetical protein